jgi:hypothetical protein
MRHVSIPFGVLSILLVLVLNLLAASAALHEWLHADAGKTDHECAVTLFAHGQMDSTAVEVAAILPVAPVEFLPLTSVSVFKALVETLPPGRGPPFSLLHS